MKTTASPQVSVVVPVYNEVAGIEAFHRSLVAVLKAHYPGAFEIVYCDDGSRDESRAVLQRICADDATCRLISLSRNFGKELAVTAGLHAAHGEAVIVLDADGQHPVELLPKFVKAWKGGAKVVIGLRTDNSNEGIVKRWGSKFFYGGFSRLSGLRLQAGATDYCLIDRSVVEEFSRLTERNRITRGLINWLGYQPEYIRFAAHARSDGQATQSFSKLSKLAVDSAVSLSLKPLYATAYIGVVMLPLATLLGLGMGINALIGDPLGLHASGSAYVTVLLLWMVSLVMLSQGIIGLYLSHIHTETQNRPLYIIDRDQSIRS